MSTLESYTHFAKQIARTGWFFGLRQMTERQVAKFGEQPPKVEITKKAPNTRQLLSDVATFLRKDAAMVREGLLPSVENDLDTPRVQFRRILEMFQDLQSAHQRRLGREGKEVAAEYLSDTSSDKDDLPDYFVQNFHYQTGGYLTDQSARLYDVQVETLFLGTSGAMRRCALGEVARYVKGRNQRSLKMLDVACGTGRFLAQVRQALPCLPLTGVDLSAAYISEAERYLKEWRAIDLKVGNAESLPVPDASQDIVTTIYLFHELPPEVRRTAVQEFARVLKPGGILVFMDSLQYGDNPNYDGLLEAFPQRFHEPYYRNYLIDDLASVFTQNNLTIQNSQNALLSKVVTCEKTY